MTVVSAGNEGSNCSSVAEPPGIYDASYSVGATNSSDDIAGFSSRGPVTVDGSNRLKPDISAPGVNIRSSIPGSYQGGWQGTSMAAPHVVGAVALLWSARPALRNRIDLTEDILNPTALDLHSTQCGDPPDTVPNNVYGWGRLDALAAVQQTPVGYLIGTVRNDVGHPVSGAAVEAALNPLHSWSTTTGAGGLYQLQVLSGTYTVTVAAPGYMSAITTGITVQTNQTSTLDITVQPYPYALCLPLLLRDS
jgi:subtilisin family serine protease